MFAKLALAIALAGHGALAATPAPTGTTFVVTGHGWGHGVGMSQYGALGYAEHGATYGQILAHYYPGTAIGPAPVTKVRVLIAADKRALTISSTADFQIKDATGMVHQVPAGELKLGPALKLKLGDTTKKAEAVPGPLVFVPGAEPLELGRPYRGTIQVTSTGGKLQAVNVVGLEAYLDGVVPSEMPHTWAAEALKAQAVVARSYALSTLKRGAFDLYSDTRSQVYRGIVAETPPSNAAVAATAGRVLLYNGQVARTYFFSTSGGRTANVTDVWPSAQPVPYLVSVDDPYDSLSPYHDWGPTIFTGVKFAKALHVPGPVVDLKTTLNSSGRVQSADAVAATGAETTVDAGDIRAKLKLRSTWFSIGVLSLSAEARRVVYGTPVKLTGIVRGLQDVTLQAHPSGSVWQGSAAVTPAADDSFAATMSPQVTTDYRLATGTVRAGALRVEIAPLVRLLPPKTTTALRGTVRPLVPGATVEIQRLSLDGKGWGPVVRTTVGADGSFEADFQVLPGTYRAYVPAGHRLAPGTSAVLRVLSA